MKLEQQAMSNFESWNRRLTFVSVGGAFCQFCKSNFERKECLEKQMSKYANFQDVQANYKAFCHGHENIWLKNWKWVTLPHISRSFVECKVIFWVLWNKKAANTYQTKKHLWHCFLYDCLLIFRHLFSKNAKVRGKLAEKSQKMGAWQLLGQHLLGRVNVLGRHKNMIYNSFSNSILFISSSFSMFRSIFQNKTKE